MTTALAYAARGEAVQSFHAHPAGLILAFAVCYVVVVASRTVLTGLRPHMPIPVSQAAGVGIPLGILLMGWLIKIAWGLVDGSLPLNR